MIFEILTVVKGRVQKVNLGRFDTYLQNLDKVSVLIPGSYSKHVSKFRKSVFLQIPIV